MHNKGFTLIEMLVVVAIIGLLSSVLLTALGPAKEKAKDARIIQEMTQARTIAETLYNQGNYSELPTDSNVIKQHASLGPLYDDIGKQGGELVIRKGSASQEYIIYSRLNTKVTISGSLQISYYCVDSTGRTAFVAQDPPSGLTCQ